MTGLEIEKINKELTDLSNKIKHYNEIIESDAIKKEIIKEELEEIKQKHANERTSLINQQTI